MNAWLRKNALQLLVPLLIGLFSFFLIAPVASSVEFHKNTLDDLQEKQTTVLELSATSAAASAAITLIPGDVATPIADKLADLSAQFLLVLCAILLEKYLLTITGTLTFSVLIPIACVLYMLYVCMGCEYLRLLAAKLAVFGLLIVFVIPASVYVSGLIEDTYEASITSTIEAAKDATAEIEDSTQTEETQKGGFLSGLVSAVTEGVSGAADQAGKIVNRFMESLAIMLVTCCVIPILVLLSFIWFAKILLSVDLPVSYSRLSRGWKQTFSRKKVTDTP